MDNFARFVPDRTTYGNPGRKEASVHFLIQSDLAEQLSRKQRVEEQGGQHPTRTAYGLREEIVRASDHAGARTVSPSNAERANLGDRALRRRIGPDSR